MIDYKELLKKYMKLVDSEEGTTFVFFANFQHIAGPVFTDEELAELKQIDKEVRDEC